MKQSYMWTSLRITSVSMVRNLRGCILGLPKSSFLCIQYLADDKVGKASVKSFATVSSCLDHGAHAIWAHLTPVLSRLAQSHPEVDTIHFVSDGPTAQYRNRTNIFLLATYYNYNHLTASFPGQPG